MSTSNFTEFNLQRNAYAAFDATSMKQLITNRLRDSNLFPDISFESSNISGLVDVLAYSYHVLLFYLNQTASDSMFSQSELLENMNRIVSLISYKPNGPSTAAMNFSVAATDQLAVSNYNIKRYSYITVRGITYSFNKDVSFNKTITGVQKIESIGTNNLLYQGTFREYPTYFAIGEEFETVTINVKFDSTTFLNKFVDYNNIFVYVRDVNTQLWSEWTEVGNLYLADNASKVFEKRYNANNNIEIKFGNNINGKALQENDEVQIFYLESDGSLGILGVGMLNEAKMYNYNSTRLSNILQDVGNANGYMTAQQLFQLNLTNEYDSIPYRVAETVDEIRNTSPLIYSSQNRAVTVNDYESFITKTFSNIIQSVKVVSNKQYTNEYLSYFYDLGLERPNLDQRLLFNQVSFNDACDFNNVYVFAVPRYGAISNETTPNQLFFSQKQAIIDKLSPIKMLTNNIVVCDPTYIAFSIGLLDIGETLTPDIKNSTVLRVTRKTDIVISKEQIKSNIYDIIKNFFSQENNELGATLDFSKLSFDLLNVDGVSKIQTVRSDTGYTVNKLSFIYWNPYYEDVDINTISQNLTLSYFKFPYYYELTNLINSIEVL
jgi:hypothetical protein